MKSQPSSSTPDPAGRDAEQEPDPELNPLRRAVAACAARLDLLLLAILVGLSLFFRLWGLDWDDGGLYHPDERAILLRVSEMTFPIGDLGSLFSVGSSWNPGWFPYGSLPLYLLKAAGYLAPPVFENPPLIELAQAGRVVSALLDTLTVVFVYLIGRRLFGRWEGLLAATMIGLAVLHIQQSHFFVSDLMLATFIMGAFYFLSKGALSTKGEKQGTYKYFAIAALFFGIALASKFSALPFAFVFVAAAALWALPEHRREPVLFATGAVALIGMAVGFSQPVFWALGVGGALGLLAWAGSRVVREVGQDPELVPRLLHAGKLLLLSAGVTIVVFTILQPYAWIDYGTYVGDIGNESQMVRRIADLPYTRQYIDTTPYLYHVQQLALWGVGLPLGILMWAGFAFSIAVAVRRRDPRHILMLAWVAPYFATVGAFDVKFLRYMLPITPLLAIMASALVSEALTVLRERRLPDLPFLRALTPRFVYIPLGAVLVLTLLYAVSFARIYNGPHPATAAADWIREQSSPRDTSIVKEHWEEGLGGVRNGLYGYHIDELEIYNPDNPIKREQMAELLADADYLVFYSSRLYGTIPRLPERYPATSDYYHALFRGELGFEIAHLETSYPNLFGVSLEHDTFGRPGLPEPQALREYKQTTVELNLGFADENVTVYDHPLVLIFEKTLEGTPQEQLAFYRNNLPWGPAVGTTASGGELLLLSEDAARAQQEGGTWSDIFNRGSFVNKIPEVVWFLAAQLAFLLALPITLMVFRWLPDRGYFLGKIFGVLLAAYIPWLLASLHWLSFSRLSVLVGLLLLGLVSAAILRRRGREILDFLREKRRVIIVGEVLFLVAFAGMFAVRMWNPDLWDLYLGGEKPMDFAYFNAVLKSTYMPPYDPWYAGGQLNYYYFGFFMGAAFTKFTGILPSIAITLIVPLFFALTAAAAYSVVYNLAALVKRRLDDAGRGPPLPSPIAAGVMAAIFVTVLGNLDGTAQLVQGLGRVLRNQDFGSFDFWRSSRMLGPEGEHGITEFPFFTFLFADPHAHLFVIPLTVLAVGLALAFIVGTRGSGGRWGVMSWPPYIALGLTLGAIQATNSWDAPTYLLIGGAAVLIAEYAARREATLGLFALAAVKMAGLYAIGYLFFLPFQQSYESFLPYTDAIARTDNQAVLWRYLGIHGFFIVVIAGFIAWRLFRRPQDQDEDGGPGGADAVDEEAGEERTPTPVSEAELSLALASFTGAARRHWNWPAYPPAWPRPRWGRLFFAAAYVIVAAALWTAGMATIVFLGSLLLALVPLVWRAARSEDAGAPVGLFVYLLIATPLAIGVAVDIWHLNISTGRMNTVFKLYLQAWVLMALASAFILWRMRFGLDLAAGLPGGWAARGWRIWRGVVLVLLVGALIYPILATPDRSERRLLHIAPTRDGMTFMNEASLYDYDSETWAPLRPEREALEWMQDNVQGSPVVVEGLGQRYRSLRSRVATYTGLPVVLGWEWHQQQQRCGLYAGAHCPREQQGVVQRRMGDVERFFSTVRASEAETFLDKYNVRYIYVGDHERKVHPAAGLEKFERMAADGDLAVVYRNETVTIYEVPV